MTNEEIQQIANEASNAKRNGNEKRAQQLLQELYVHEVFARAARIACLRFGKPSRFVAEDIEHEIWLRCSQAIGSFADKGCRFLSWLSVIGKNIIHDQLRRKSTKQSQLGEYGVIVDDSCHTSETSAILNELRAFLAEPFSDEDWCTISSWRLQNVRDAVLVIGGFGFQPKILSDSRHTQQWLDWLTELDFENPLDFVQRIGSIDLDDINGRLKAIGAEVGLDYNSISKDFDRKRHLVVGLEFFWKCFLSSFSRFSTQQHEAVLGSEVAGRVAVLSIDGCWNRSGTSPRWHLYVGDYPFKGIPPMLRFAETPEIENRIDVLVNATSKRANTNMSEVIRLLRANNALRELLKLSE